MRTKVTLSNISVRLSVKLSLYGTHLSQFKIKLKQYLRHISAIEIGHVRFDPEQVQSDNLTSKLHRKLRRLCYKKCTAILNI